MAELLILANGGADPGPLSDALRAAIPDCEVVDDRWRTLAIISSPLALSAFDPEELRRREEQDGGSTFSGAPYLEVIAVVLPTLAAATVEVTVALALDWLRSVRDKPRRESTVVMIYGPNGEPLRKVRLRRDDSEPEMFTRSWPLEQRDDDPN